MSFQLTPLGRGVASPTDRELGLPRRRARAGRSRQRQSKWAGSTRRCTRTALVTAPFPIGHPAAARSARPCVISARATGVAADSRTLSLKNERIWVVNKRLAAHEFTGVNLDGSRRSVQRKTRRVNRRADGGQGLGWP